MKNIVIALAVVSLVASLTIACNNVYKAGNLNHLGFPIETDLHSNLMVDYINKMAAQGEYTPPRKWSGIHKLDELDPENIKRVYFQSEPEEMYVLSFGGMPVLSDVYNTQISAGGWVVNEKLLTTHERKRIMDRLQKFLNLIERKAIEDGVPDSVIHRY